MPFCRGGQYYSIEVIRNLALRPKSIGLIYRMTQQLADTHIPLAHIPQSADYCYFSFCNIWDTIGLSFSIISSLIYILDLSDVMQCS